MKFTYCTYTIWNLYFKSANSHSKATIGSWEQMIIVVIYANVWHNVRHSALTTDQRVYCVFKWMTSHELSLAESCMPAHRPLSGLWSVDRRDTRTITKKGYHLLPTKDVVIYRRIYRHTCPNCLFHRSMDKITSLM